MLKLAKFLALLLFAGAAAAQPSLKILIPANPGGAAGTIGLAQSVNGAKGDADAMMVGGMVMIGGIYLNQSPVNLGMVTPVARLTSEWEVVVVPANSPHKSMADLVKAFQANPGALS